MSGYIRVRTRLFIVSTVGLLAVLLLVCIPRTVYAQDNGEFALQVTPSPLVATVKPGQATQLELKIYNKGPRAEELKLEPRSFTYDSHTEQVKLNERPPRRVAGWLHFSSPVFTVAPGQAHTEKITIDVPADAGFSYSFTLIIRRTGDPVPAKSASSLQGAVAVFTLLNIDRPGAKRTLKVDTFTADHGVYEYLPATFNVRLKNTGNTISQPGGNIFIRQGNNEIAALKLNNEGKHVLPDSTRTVSAQWEDGFPVYQMRTGTDGAPKPHLSWNWSTLSDFRIGVYSAKLVGVYNDGKRDVPLTGEIRFWVLPWKLLLGALVLLLLIGAGVWSWSRKLAGAVRKGKEQVGKVRANRGNRHKS